MNSLNHLCSIEKMEEDLPNNPYIQAVMALKPDEVAAQVGELLNLPQAVELNLISQPDLVQTYRCRIIPKLQLKLVEKEPSDKYYKICVSLLDGYTFTEIKDRAILQDYDEREHRQNLNYYVSSSQPEICLYGFKIMATNLQTRTENYRLRFTLFDEEREVLVTYSRAFYVVSKRSVFLNKYKTSSNHLPLVEDFVKQRLKQICQELLEEGYDQEFVDRILEINNRLAS